MPEESTITVRAAGSIRIKNLYGLQNLQVYSSGSGYPRHIIYSLCVAMFPQRKLNTICLDQKYPINYTCFISNFIGQTWFKDKLVHLRSKLFVWSLLQVVNFIHFKLRSIWLLYGESSALLMIAITLPTVERRYSTFRISRWRLQCFFYGTGSQTSCRIAWW